MNRFWLLILLLNCVEICVAKEYRDTLWTTDNDRIIISYDIRHNQDRVDIQFLDVRKKLGQINGKRYKKLEEVDVIFFDRTGVYEDMTFTNITPEAFMVPANLQYSKSVLGYFSVLDHPSLTFHILKKEDSAITIPLYLAYYAGRGKRRLFSVCKQFRVELNKSILTNTITNDFDKSESITSIYEIAADNDLAIEVSTQVNTIMSLLEVQTQLPFRDRLQYEIIYLRNLQKEVKDKQLASKIKECLTLCDLKQIELEEKALLEAKRLQIEAETSARIEREQEQFRQDSIAMVQQKQAESEKKRNVWKIIGGVILVAICFVGNQAFQHFRNIKNQKSMMEMQQEITRSAENEAKRHARNYARRKTSEVVNKARKSTLDIAKNQVKQFGGKKNKNISI